MMKNYWLTKSHTAKPYLFPHDDAAKFIFDGGIFANYKKAVTAGAAVFDGEWNIGNFNP